ncbi:hypothetical protein [Lentzea flava]|uniref:Uncharacterized protein n=1 Tax=Lentzea flava TaxID=103732 RepID=A0ABQ2UZK3_9PSEU|nr:hypothetical protein [Lentzea flava]MCP2202712.1 hypothetical protein [Lentzea flava]GGU61734.1 hypothetical protein GCM10010178_62390 [Lentzea flava]
MNQPQPTGAQLRDAGVADVLAADQAVHRGYRDEIESVLEELIASGAEFTADDLQARLTDDTRLRAAPSLISAVIAVAARQGRIRQTGWGTSTRPTRHHGVLRRWRGPDMPGQVPDAP